MSIKAPVIASLLAASGLGWGAATYIPGAFAGGDGNNGDRPCIKPPIPCTQPVPCPYRHSGYRYRDRDYDDWASYGPPQNYYGYNGYDAADYYSPPYVTVTTPIYGYGGYRR